MTIASVGGEGITRSYRVHGPVEEIEITDGEVTNFYVIRNPDKLLALAVPRQISR